MELNSLGVALAAERIAQSPQQAWPPRPQARRTGRCRHHAVPTLKETAMAVESASPWQAAARAAARSRRGGFGAGQDLRHDPGHRRHRPGRACTCTATRANSSPTQRSMPMTSDTTSHLDLTVMVAFHDAFRRDLGHLARTASRRPAELDDPARHTAVQARIDPLLDAVEGAFADRDGGHQRLGDTVDALASALYGHLGHEERDALPLIDRSLTQAEWQAFGNDQRRLIGTGGAQLFPWLLDEASAEQIQAVLGGCRRRCGWSTGGSGSPATPATTTGSHPRRHEHLAARSAKNEVPVQKVMT